MCTVNKANYVQYYFTMCNTIHQYCVCSKSKKNVCATKFVFVSNNLSISCLFVYLLPVTFCCVVLWSILFRFFLLQSWLLCVVICVPYVDIFIWIFSSFILVDMWCFPLSFDFCFSPYFYKPYGVRIFTGICERFRLKCALFTLFACLL